MRVIWNIVFFSVFSISLGAQKVADFAKVDSSKNTDGFFFYLPRTAVEFEFTITETRYIKGELSDYANQYFQTKPDIMRNRSEYSIDNISMKHYPIPDPLQKYSYSAETASQVSIQTVAGGIIKSINANLDLKNNNTSQFGIVSTFNKNEEAKDASIPFFSLGVKSDTIFNREITADSTVIERRVINRRTVTNTPEEMAKESVQKLDDIRKVRFTLISGPEDVALEGTTLETSLRELEKTEQELLALFFGRTKRNTQTYRFTFIPGESPEVLFYLSPELGLSTLAGAGHPSVKVTVNNFSGRGIKPEPAITNGVIPYRSSEKMVLSIQWNGSKYFETELMLPQFGQLHTVPVKKLSALKVVYDEQSGAIESIGPAEK